MQRVQVMLSVQSSGTGSGSPTPTCPKAEKLIAESAMIIAETGIQIDRDAFFMTNPFLVEWKVPARGGEQAIIGRKTKKFEA